MPNINLRLTEEQHTELTAWARDGHRSLQKEIIWRLFTQPGYQGAVDAYIKADAQPRNVTARTIVSAEDHFKPDFKK
jgi:hypothetical protein